MARRNRKTVVLSAVAAVAILGGSAFTAGTGLEEHTAGTGSVTVSGINVTGIAYNLDAERENIESVVFTSDDLEDGMVAEFALSGAWDDCETIAAVDTEITCSPTAATSLSAVDKLALTVTNNASVS